MLLLSNIQERLERSIFEQIRLLVVEQGYLPNITDFVDDVIDTPLYKAALDQIRKNKGFAIEVFGVSNSQAKGVLKTPRIVLLTRRFLPTDVGLPQSIQFLEDPQNPDKYLIHKLDSRFQYMVMEIQLISGTAKEDRILHQILAAALGSRGYLPFYDSKDKCEKFFLEQISYFDNQNTEQGILTKYYQYKFDNISIFYGEVDSINKIAKIKEIKISPNIPDIMPVTGLPEEDLGNVVSDSDLIIP